MVFEHNIWSTVIVPQPVLSATLGRARAEHVFQLTLMGTAIRYRVVFDNGHICEDEHGPNYANVFNIL